MSCCCMLLLQAASDLEDNVQHVAALMGHPAFDITNPQACEHLLWGFAASIPNFHAEDGSGYAFMADAILKVRPTAASATGLCHSCISMAVGLSTCGEACVAMCAWLQSCAAVT